MIFFRKNKRIKELEAENEALQKEIMFLKAREYLSDKKPLNVEIYRATERFSLGVSLIYAEREVKRRLSEELYSLMRVEKDYDPGKDKFLIRASIRVVKE